MGGTSTEEKIIGAAIPEFAQYGFEGSRVDRIARRAKVNKAMIYYHFKSKERLYETILTDLYTAAYKRITGGAAADRDHVERLEEMIEEFINFIQGLDQNIVKMMLRELASGGRYFKKLMLPHVILPSLNMVSEIIDAGVRDGIFKRVSPQFTFIQTLGSIVFANALRVVLVDTDLGKSVFGERFFEEFKRNLLLITKTGILVRQ